MQSIPRLQFLQATYRGIIRSIQDDIVTYKTMKSVYDKNGNQEMEYEFHNLLVAARKELKKWVEVQMDCKQQLRDAYNFERYCNKPSTEV